MLGSIRLPDSKVLGASMGHNWVLSAPDGPHVGPMNLAIGAVIHNNFTISVTSETEKVFCWLKDLKFKGMLSTRLFAVF